MIPIYAVVSFLSYLFYRNAVYWEVIGNCYEAFAIASFFTLLCHYIAPNLHEQKEYFRNITPKNWFWGVFGLQRCTGGENKGPFRKPRSGLTWFNIVWIGVFQYCFIRVFFTIVSVLTEYYGRYCEASLSPAFAHIWVTAFEAVSVTIAMFCLIQFYIQLREDLAEHKPFLKVLCIKLVIFFSFWQTIIISMISSANGPLKPTNKISYQDIKTGIPSVLLCIEMAIFATMHIFAFPWKPYSLKHNDPLTMQGAGFSGDGSRYKGGPFGIKALGDAFNPWDIIKASARGFRWLFVGFRHRTEDRSYQAPSKLSGNTGYLGPAFAGSGEAATELHSSDDPSSRRGDGGPADDDTAGLLRHPAEPGQMHTSSPYRPYGNERYTPSDDSRVDLGTSDLYQNPPEAKFLDGAKANDYGPGRQNRLDEEDVGYHPGIVPQERYPMYRNDDGNDGGQAQWNHWGGVDMARTTYSAESVRPPPSYSTLDTDNRI